MSAQKYKLGEAVTIKASNGDDITVKVTETGSKARCEAKCIGCGVIRNVALVAGQISVRCRKCGQQHKHGTTTDRTCIECYVIKPIDAFSLKKKGGKEVRRRICDACREERESAEAQEPAPPPQIPPSLYQDVPQPTRRFGRAIL